MARLFYYSLDRELNRLAHTLVREHGFIFASRNKHTKLRAPDGRMLMLPVTPGNRRTIHNRRAFIRREFGIAL